MAKQKKSLYSILFWLSLALFLACLYMALPYLKGLMPAAKALKGPVRVEKGGAGWRLTVGGKPFFVQGVCYGYTPVGKGVKYDLFSDASRPWLADGPLMKRMGVNAVRLYKPGTDRENTRAFIRDLYGKFGIKTALGHYLGYWEWPLPNYSDPMFTARIKAEVLDMVEAYKDEDGILFWILGNENNYSFDRGEREWSNTQLDAIVSPVDQRREKARIYYTFVNDIAKQIKKIDPNHPVVMGNGELASIDVAKECCPDVDILGGIVYQGKSFGSFFEKLKRNFGKPNVFIEFGSDAYDSVWQQEAQDWQAFFLKLLWLEIIKNRAGADGAGNSLGGFIFEWCDEWWKHNPESERNWHTHDTEAGWANTAYYFDAKAGNNMSEEWWGIVSLDPKHSKNGVIKRVPRKAYYILRSYWVGSKHTERKKFAFFSAGFLALAIFFAIAGRKDKQKRGGV
jgi:hypothetical protein